MQTETGAIVMLKCINYWWLSHLPIRPDPNKRQVVRGTHSLTVIAACEHESVSRSDYVVRDGGTYLRISFD